MNLNYILMSARWVGLFLIVLGWSQIVPILVGWIGFGLAGISFILESKYKKNLPPPITDGNSDELSAPNNKDKNDS